MARTSMKDPQPRTQQSQQQQNGAGSSRGSGGGQGGGGYSMVTTSGIPAPVAVSGLDAMSNFGIETALSRGSNIVWVENRRASFAGGRWPFDRFPGARCTSNKLAEAGFFYTGTTEEPASAQCAICFKDLCFEPNDDPWLEHVSHSSDCQLVKFGPKKEEDLSVEQFLLLAGYRQACLIEKFGIDMAQKYEGASNEVKENFLGAIEYMEKRNRTKGGGGRGGKAKEAKQMRR